MYVSEENWAPEQSLRKVALTIILVLGLIVLSSSSKSMVHPEAEDVLDAPSLGGCNGTYLIVPPGISILLIYLGDRSVFKTDRRRTTLILVEKRFKNNDLVSWLNKGHESAQHAWSS